MIQRTLLPVLPAAALAVFLLAGQPARRVTRGGDILPVRSVVDPYPVFNGIAVDSENNIVAMTDGNRKSLLIYDRTAGSADSEEETPPLRQIIGPETNLGFVAGIMIDPRKREVFAVNNDIEDTLLVLPCQAKGNVHPTRLLSVPHQAWGLAYSPSRQEMAVSVQLANGIVFYRLAADGVEAPLRSLQGPDTGLADPHGIAWDEANSEIAVANHGNYRGLAKNMGQGCTLVNAGGVNDSEAGQFQPPSITVYPAASKGDQKPRRAIQGPATQLDWPMGLAVDSIHNEIAVANNGDNSVLFYRRTASGDAAPIRAIRGPRTRLNRPMGLAIDAKNDEVWVANFADHTAVAFNRSAAGDQAPKRVIRNAPAGTPSAGFGNPMAMAYDSKREEILVPN